MCPWCMYPWFWLLYPWSLHVFVILIVVSMMHLSMMHDIVCMMHIAMILSIDPDACMYLQGGFFDWPPLKSSKYWARLGVSRSIYVNVDTPNLGFTYFNFFLLFFLFFFFFWGGGEKKPPCTSAPSLEIMYQRLMTMNTCIIYQSWVEFTGEERHSIFGADNMSGEDSFLAIVRHPIKKWKDPHSYKFET